ncbi:glutathione S-transferase [Nitrosomonas cryotolerans]|uniref:Glutathione S-transferase n=1 Tax=Nitrosomonas cryotolerans ATCC 49181 TaxID=1131553 RepID=A0A1N6HCX1_9PROT|nr:glutathione S-transferase [Nitrosomonas cryotolerans]SFP73692.1 glutathione S-transferase [Nitrosomonas cryotolerans]SIO17547.1 glutathione S-transferase [Nitrosomonas cryotolerans ATCC 49181]
MKIIGSLTSPYVRKVRIILAEKQIHYEFSVDNPWDSSTRVSSHNPLGKIPVLIMDNEDILYDSRVIAEYLDSIESPQSAIHLIPRSSYDRTMVKRWEALADGICDAAATIFLERKRPTSQQSHEWIARQQQKIEMGIKAAAVELGDREWCHGHTFTLADIALGCAMDYLTLRFPEIQWRATYANLTGLAGRLTQRTSFIDTAPKG